MSLPPHREKDAKVEGRDPPEPAKETMAPFRTLMGRLLKVTPDEVKEQQKLFDRERSQKDNAPAVRKGNLAKTRRSRRIPLAPDQSPYEKPGNDKKT